MTKLFVVPKPEQKAQPPVEPEEVESEPFEPCGGMAVDLETAIRALAFLIQWGEDIAGAEGLRI